jgi:hypothetical protein
VEEAIVLAEADEVCAGKVGRLGGIAELLQVGWRGVEARGRVPKPGGDQIRVGGPAAPDRDVGFATP